jgi:ankyrin repeat protein
MSLPHDMPQISLLIHAATGGNKHILKQILGFFVDVNLVWTNGMSALLTAVENGHTECVALLLEAGSEPNYMSSDNEVELNFLYRPCASFQASHSIKNTLNYIKNYCFLNLGLQDDL